jgi:hypothetical protein
MRGRSEDVAALSVGHFGGCVPSIGPELSARDVYSRDSPGISDQKMGSFSDSTIIAWRLPITSAHSGQPWKCGRRIRTVNSSFGQH